ncbi:MAG: hypothetical protein Q7T91_10830 [Sulfuricurvum sp.]|nr:hypothetical protein [Sulfuricurvum sp.]
MKKLSSYKPTTPLERSTLAIIKSNIEKGYEESFFNDLMIHGCISGMVTEMIAYSSTTKFFTTHKDEINKMLSSTLGECGLSCPSELFGNKFDTDDFLCFGTMNMNLLAWFAFEETARQIANNIGMEF